MFYKKNFSIYANRKASRLVSHGDFLDFCRKSRREEEYDGPEYSREELEERRQGRQDHLDALDRIKTKREEE